MAGPEPCRDIAENLEMVRERMALAARRAGRRPEDVTLVAVSKGVPAEVVLAAAAAGVTDFGENRVQEGLGKRDEVARSRPRLRWHLIGHLQTNKASRAAGAFDVIHSVDSPRVAGALSRAVAQIGGGGPLDVLVQVNASGETSKFGVDPTGAVELVRTVSLEPGLRLRGLMTIAPFVSDPEEARPVFRRVRRLAEEIDRLALPGVSMDVLSMGMTQDYEVAISEGTTMVRIGTAVFGPRRG